MEITIERQSMDVDIVCVGFGPAAGGFLTTVSERLMRPDGTPLVESKVMPGMPPQIICYERADDIGFGVSGVVTGASAIRESFSDLDVSAIPMAVPVTSERMLYLLDPHKKSGRSFALGLTDRVLRVGQKAMRSEHFAVRLPYIPDFLQKEGGLLLSIGQFNQWVGAELMAKGVVQLWPGSPVAQPLIEGDRVVGVRLVDQGTDKEGNPDAAFMPGMDIKARLTVVADGAVGPVGRALDEHFGLPSGHDRREWALGMKVVIDLPKDSTLEPGTVFHTFGYPEPEIFGFLYVYAEKDGGRKVSAGIFVPSWFSSPVRSAYRYLQRWMKHPYLWRYLEGGTLSSFGAKSLQESGRRGEPHLCGDGYARIGEGSGSTNVLAGSGVDEGWATGVQLGQGVVELLHADAPFTKENLENAYVVRRRNSYIETSAKISENARDGFGRGMIPGLVGMGLTGLTQGRVHVPGRSRTPNQNIDTLEEYFRRRVKKKEIDEIRANCMAKGEPLHDALMARIGWPEIEPDGKLIVSLQDALLLGGKVQAPPGYADHVRFLHPEICKQCNEHTCVEMCSGQAITNQPEGGVRFDREKCIHCGACSWNCSKPDPENPELSTVRFCAGAGGLHSAEN